MPGSTLRGSCFFGVMSIATYGVTGTVNSVRATSVSLGKVGSERGHPRTSENADPIGATYSSNAAAFVTILRIPRSTHGGRFEPRCGQLRRVAVVSGSGAAYQVPKTKPSIQEKPLSRVDSRSFWDRAIAPMRMSTVGRRCRAQIG
jgi:hypothetical protein